MASYLKQFTVAFALFLVLVASVNVLVDPYRLWYPYVGLDTNAARPRAVQHDAFVKLRGIAKRQPITVVLGNSRAEIGFDPASPIWPSDARPVYNAAIPGSGVAVARMMLAAAIAEGRLRRAVVGLDFLDFLVDPSDPVRPPAPADPTHLLPVTSELSLAFSSDTLFDSLRTLASMGDGESADVRADGFNPLMEYRRYAREEGYASLFLQKDAMNARSYMKEPKSLFAKLSRTSSTWDELEALVQMTREAGIQVDFVIYPYHARILEMFYKAGLAPAFKSWKRELVKRLDHSERCRLWDFSGYDDITTEPVPAPGDKTSVTRWYWESGHFKPALGNRILARVFAEDAANFGTCLTRANVELQNESLDHGHSVFRASFPNTAREIERLFGSP